MFIKKSNSGPDSLLARNSNNASLSFLSLHNALLGMIFSKCFLSFASFFLFSFSFSSLFSVSSTFLRLETGLPLAGLRRDDETAVAMMVCGMYFGEDLVCKSCLYYA